MGIRAALRDRYLTLSLWQQRLVAAVSLILLCGTLVEFIDQAGATAASNANAVDATGPISVRQGDNVIVPINSPLRSRLVVSAVDATASAHQLALPGVVEADPARTVNILPPLTGRLTGLAVELGDNVRAGQLLAIIHSPDLDQAYSDVDKARDALDLAHKALDRARSVHDAGANAVKDFEQANSSYEQALAEAKRAESRLATLGGNNQDGNSRTLRINSPISGTVTTLSYGIGSFINDPTVAIMTISNLDHVWITANVPEDVLASISKGQAAEVDLPAYPGQKFHGTISFVSTVLEPDTHRNKARIAFANPGGRLKPNMYATVSVAVPQAKAVTVPTSALLMNNDSTTVFIEVAPWTFARRVVELGREDEDKVRILSGLSAGDRVVVRGGVLLND